RVAASLTMRFATVIAASGPASRKAQGDVALTLTEEALGHGATPAAPAVDTLERVLPDHPGTALLQARLRPGLVPEARLTLARAPGAEEAYLMLAEPLAEDDPGAALSYLDHGLSACRSTLRLRLRRAALLEATGQKEAAIAEYELLHVIAPYSLLVVNNLASLLAETSNERGDLARAKRLAVRLAGHDVPEFLDTRGWVAVRNGRPQEGIPLLEAAAERLPENPAVWYHLGIASMRVGDRARARTTLAQAVRLDTSGRFRYHDVARKFLKRTDSGADALPSPSGSDLRRPSVR
ncbi:MAG: tetratricopeptide repeat protein, partial [Pseudomonadota bacterium]